MKLVVPLITPFGESFNNYYFDKYCFEALINFVKDYVDAFFLLSTTGETPRMNEKLIKEVFESGLKILKNKTEKPIYLGIPSDKIFNEYKSLYYSLRQDKDAFVVIPGKVKKIPEDFPILIYNNPTLTKNKNISKKKLEEILRNFNCIGMKDSSSNLKIFEGYREILENKLLYQGDELTFFKAYEKGIKQDGICAGFANCYPKFWRNVLDGTINIEEAKRFVEKYREEERDYIVKIKKELNNHGICQAITLPNK